MKYKRKKERIISKNSHCWTHNWGKSFFCKKYKQKSRMWFLCFLEGHLTL